MKKLLLSALLLAAFAAGAQTKESLIGCWTMPSRAGESIQLNRDGDFSFNDFNKKTNVFENLYGTWSLAGNKLTLLYSDRSKQTFTLVKDKAGKWMMTKTGGFQFMKAQPGDCAASEGMN